MAINRTVAGVHFPVDSAAGMVLARTLSEYYIARFSGVGDVYTRTFDGRGFARDFSYEDIWEVSDQPCAAANPQSLKICRSAIAVQVPKSDLLSHLWSKAVAEWK